MEPFRTEKIDTNAGTYTINLYSDYDASNPLENWDNGVLVQYAGYGSRWDNGTDLLDDADHAAMNIVRTYLAENYRIDDIQRRYDIWQAISQSSWELITGTGSSSQSDYYRWFALVNKDYLDSKNAPTPEEYAKQIMSVYRQWASGGFCGYVTTDPAGNEIDSLWDIDNDDYAIEEATENVNIDAKNRLDQSNLVGAGIVGII